MLTDEETIAVDVIVYQEETSMLLIGSGQPRLCDWSDRSIIPLILSVVEGPFEIGIVCRQHDQANRPQPCFPFSEY